MEQMRRGALLTGDNFMPAPFRLVPEWKTERWPCALRLGCVPGARRWNALSLPRQARPGGAAKLSTFMRKTLFHRQSARLFFALCVLVTGLTRAQIVVSPPNYAIATPGTQFEFQVNGVNTTSNMVAGTDDSLNFGLNAGATYIFSVNTASIHPMDICTTNSTSAHYSGASAQAVSSGTVTLTIPATNYPPKLFYICNIHSFYGIITVNPPQPPPLANITRTSITTNIILTFSGGTNTIQLVPQFSSNLANNVWLPVPKYTNTYSGTGTNNTTSFGRLDAICGPDVFIRISQAGN